MTPLDLARDFLKKGRVDERVCYLLRDRPEIEDDPFGLHAQQAIEKYLKAILALGQERPERTHDLKVLAGQCEEVGHPLPPWAAAVFDLTPFASEFRYPSAVVPPIDRDEVLAQVVAVREWAEQIIG